MTTEKQKLELLKKLYEDRKKKMSNNITDAIISLYSADLPVYDIKYIEARLREIIEQTIKKLDFYSESVEKAKNLMLRQMLFKLKENLPAKREFRKKTTDPTEQRDMRCEPIIYELIDKFLDEKILLEDSEYLKESFKEQNEVMFTVIVAGYIQTLFDGIGFSADQSLKLANEILWNGKTKEEITWKEMQKVLKSNEMGNKMEGKK